MRQLFFIVIFGIFAVIAFFVVTYILKKNELGVGVWPIMGVAILFITAGEYIRAIRNDVTLYQYFLLVAMILMFFAALVKFWDSMGFTQRFK
jgi:hypothetical protein